MSNRSDKSTVRVRICSNHGPMVRNGHYRRKSDSKTIKRWRCLKCGKTISEATGTKCFGQNKRRVNPIVRHLLSSSVSQRRMAKILKVHRTTIARKLLFIAKDSREKNQEALVQKEKRSIRKLQFDEMETFEHTKMKPLSIAVLVNPETREILGAKVAEMPARGSNARKSVKKYGKRKDDRSKAMSRALQEVEPYLRADAELTSDKKSTYPKLVKFVNTGWNHVRVKGRKPCSIGQGELKEGGYDPLFCLNHTCAMIRDSVKRLARRNWCTTKLADRLQDHLDIYREYHNSELI